MNIAEIRDLIIIIYGALGIAISFVLLILSLVVFWKVLSLLKEIQRLMNKVKIISSYAARELVEPLIGLAVLIQSVSEGIQQVKNIFSGKGRKK
jgi:hypothetical protein